MLIPSKYENLSTNLFVIGSFIIRLLKKKHYNIEDLFQLLKKNHSVNFELFVNTLTFLWLADIIVIDTYQISLNSNGVNYVSQKNLL